MSDVPGLDYYFDTMLDKYLDRYFEDSMEDRMLGDEDMDYSDKDE